MKTWNPKPEEVERKWYVVDAKGEKVGRVATHVANLLRGKGKPSYTPHMDTGDFVIVLNTDQMVLTGSKWQDKKYFRHSRWFGSMKTKTAEQMQQDDSTFIIKEAVRGMLPPCKLSRRLILKMKSFKGSDHDHSAQKPESYNLHA
ncbi:MAG: 50S ribosomal protein L13 [Bdellovibrionota bacterium]